MYMWGYFLNKIFDAIEFVIPNKFHNIFDFFKSRTIKLKMIKIDLKGREMIIFMLISNIIWKKKFYY